MEYILYLSGRTSHSIVTHGNAKATGSPLMPTYARIMIIGGFNTVSRVTADKWETMMSRNYSLYAQQKCIWRYGRRVQSLIY